MRARVVLAVLITSVAMIEAPQLARADAPWFTGVGDLKGGGRTSKVGGISNDGTTVVGTGCSAGSDPNQSFVWTRESGMFGIGDLNGGSHIGSGALGVSSDGTYVVGGSESDNTEYGEGYIWSQAEGMIGLGDLPGGEFYSLGYAVSDDGNVVVGGSTTKRSQGLEEGFRWTRDDGIGSLGDFPGGNYARVANGVSRDGVIASGWGGGKNGGSEGFYYTEESGIVGIGELQKRRESRANNISGDGKFIVGDAGFTDKDGSGVEAFIWSDELGMVGLGGLVEKGHRYAVAMDVSDDGKVVVGWQNGGGNNIAWIWDEQVGMRSLLVFLRDELKLSDAEKWKLESAVGISADGRTIVGNGTNPNGQYEGWVVHIPEPATLALLAVVMVFARRQLPRLRR